MPTKSEPLNEQLYMIALETLAAPVVALDAGARVRLFNRAAERASGIPKEEILGEEIWSIVHPDERAGARVLFRRILEGAELSPVDLPWVSRDGETVHIVWTYMMLDGTAADSPVLICTGIDVSEQRALEARQRELEAEDAIRKVREEALRTSEARFAGIVELASDAIITVSESGSIVLFNQGAERIFGYPASEMLGKPLDTLLPERYRDRHRGHLRDFGEQPTNARRMGDRNPISGVRRSGEEFPAEASILKLELDGERLFTVVLRDVTDRKRIEAEQGFLAKVGHELTTSLDVDRVLQGIAKLAVGELSDYCVVDLVGQPGDVRRLSVAHGTRARASLAAQLQEVELDRGRPHLAFESLSTGRPQLVSEVSAADLARVAQSESHLRTLKEINPASWMTVPMVAGGDVLGVILLIASSRSRRFDERDLELATELGRRAGMALENARLYQDAQRALQARDDVLGVVSHDLGNPLQAVFIGLEGLERARIRTGEVGDDHYLTAIRHSADLMRKLIEELLEVRRMEAGHLHLERHEQAFPPLVKLALSMIEPLARVKEITITNRVAEVGFPRVNVDGNRLQQVLSNLLGNAVKHTPAGGRITIEASLGSGELLVSISDTGPGIPEESLDQVFDRFWRAEKTGGKGLGLGLAIAKGIILGHNGRIWAENGEGGAGSVFHFTLPLPPATEA